MPDDTPDPLTRLSYEPIHHLLDSLILGSRRDEAIEHLRNYFDTDLYSGRWFDRLDGGGDRPEVANRITTADLAALPLLGVELHRGDMVLDLLEHRADEITKLLTTIPTDIAMHEAPWSALAPGSPADTLYRLLRWCHGVDMIVASKLLARKRPHLLPAYEQLVSWLPDDQSDNHWACIWTWLTGLPQRAEALVALHDEVPTIADVSLVRRLDVVLWMEAKHQTGS